MISVLLPVRHAEATIARTIASLLEASAGLHVEVILTICEGDNSLADITKEEPLHVVKVKAPAGVPQLRREAALRARGEYLVITEDHCCFPAHWLADLLNIATRNSGAVCGGPVDNGRLTPVGWAQYFTRYSAFLPTGPDRTGTNLPGNNACYPRELIESQIELLRDGFWEAEFNQDLAKTGVPFKFVQKLAVEQHQHRGAVKYAPLRFRHGRCYGSRRFAGLRAAEKTRLVLLSPVLPILLYGRILRSVVRARWKRAKFLIASPLIVVYVCAWSLGEIVGYLVGPGSSCTETD